MIKSIKSRLIYLKRRRIEIISIILSIVLLFEGYLYYERKLKDTNHDNEVEDCQNLDKEVNIKEIVSDLTQKKVDILSIEKVENSYNIEVSIKGERDKIYRDFISLENYKIINYEFSAENGSLEGKVQLSYN